MTNVRATVAYTGGGFHGFAANEGVRTVAGDIEAALAKIIGEHITITCAGRTDKGVHGRGQVISFEIPGSGDGHDQINDLDRIQHSLNRMCGPTIAISDMQRVPEAFNARFSATWRQYRYHVWNSATPDPFRVGNSWHVQPPLDVARMNTAAAQLVGTHDFSSFCRRPTPAEGEPEKSLVRDVLSAEWFRGAGPEAELLTFWVRATSFCHQMVRSFVGTTVDVGLGRIEPDAIPGILAAQDRQAAGRVAPPDGLTLWEVGY